VRQPHSAGTSISSPAGGGAGLRQPCRGSLAPSAAARRAQLRQLRIRRPDAGLHHGHRRLTPIHRTPE
jgi:hypothetical protein